MCCSGWGYTARVGSARLPDVPGGFECPPWKVLAMSMACCGCVAVEHVLAGNLAELRVELDRGLLAYAGRRFKLSPDLRVLLDAGCPAS